MVEVITAILSTLGLVYAAGFKIVAGRCEGQSRKQALIKGLAWPYFIFKT